jgi:hypothetical protein
MSIHGMYLTFICDQELVPANGSGVPGHMGGQRGLQRGSHLPHHDQRPHARQRDGRAGEGMFVPHDWSTLTSGAT